MFLHYNLRRFRLFKSLFAFKGIGEGGTFGVPGTEVDGLKGVPKSWCSRLIQLGVHIIDLSAF